MKLQITPLILFLSAAFAVQADSSMEQVAADVRTNCKADIERLCRGIEPGGGRIKACLIAKKDQLSRECSKALLELKQNKGK